MSGGKGGGDCYTVGYRYYAGLHHVLCEGPIDAVQVLEVGGRVAWSGSQGQGTISVAAPDLFGGDAREGGIVGPVHIALGASNQTPNSYLAGQVGLLYGSAPQHFEASLSSDESLSVVLTVESELNGDPQSQDRTLSTTSWVEFSLPAHAGGTMTISATTSVADVLLRIVETEELIATLEQGDTVEVFEWGIVLDTSGMPAYRGVVSAIWEYCQIAANNPYLKDPRWQVRRTTTHDGWYSGKANINGGMNPAHRIREMLIRHLGAVPDDDIDDASFTTAADTLFSEGLGLNLAWVDGSVENHIEAIKEHIDARLYQAPDTGLWKLTLIRADYDAGSLEVLNGTNVLEVSSYERRGWDETVNEVAVSYIDMATGKEMTVTVQNPANIAIQGAVVRTSRSYPGLGYLDLAARIAGRDLTVLSRPLARASMSVDRTAWAWYPGQPVRWQWPDYGIADVIFRVASIDYGMLADGAIKLDLVEDVFGIPSASYIAEQPPQWTDPASEPLPCPNQAVIEAPYWDVAHTLSAADLASMDADAGYLITFGERPNSIHYDYRIYSDDGAGYVSGNVGSFTPTAVLADDIIGATTTLLLTGAVGFGEVTTGIWAQVGNELVAVTAVGTGNVTVDRGVLDTTPVSWTEGTRVWFGGARRGSESIERTDGEDVALKLLTRTGLGPLALTGATAMDAVLASRAARPYPPGDTRINGEVWPHSINGDMDITWTHRDRTQQTAYLVAQDETDIGPEAGTTYRVRIYDSGNTLKRTWSGISGTSQAYTEAERDADFGANQMDIRIVVDSQRDGLDSWQGQVRQVSELWDGNTLAVCFIDEASTSPITYTDQVGEVVTQKWIDDRSGFEALDSAAQARVLCFDVLNGSGTWPVWPYVGDTPGPCTIEQAPRNDPEVLLSGQALTGAWIRDRIVAEFGTSEERRTVILLIDTSGSMDRSSIADGLDEFEANYSSEFRIVESWSLDERWLRWLTDAVG